jgi:hypothetical protein
MKEKADVLVKLLRGRMKSLMKRRIEWIQAYLTGRFDLNMKISLLLQYMTLVEHVKSDLSYLDESMSLLTPNVNQFLVCTNFPEHKGAYLY